MTKPPLLFFVLCFSINATTDIPSLDAMRIDAAYNEIQKDQVRNARMRAWGQAGMMSVGIGTLYGLYRMFKSEEFSLEDKRVVAQLIENYKKSLGQQNPQGTGGQRFGLMRSFFYFVGPRIFVDIVSAVTLQRILGPLLSRLGEVFQERTISWFIGQRTVLKEIFRQIKAMSDPVNHQQNLLFQDHVRLLIGQMVRESERVLAFLKFQWGENNEPYLLLYRHLELSLARIHSVSSQDFSTLTCAALDMIREYEQIIELAVIHDAERITNPRSS